MGVLRAWELLQGSHGTDMPVEEGKDAKEGMEVCRVCRVRGQVCGGGRHLPPSPPSLCSRLVICGDRPWQHVHWFDGLVSFGVPSEARVPSSLLVLRGSHSQARHFPTGFNLDSDSH